VRLVMDVAAAQEVFATRQRMGEAVIGQAHALKTRALVKLGELLKALPKAKGCEHGGRSRIDGSRVEPSNPTPTYADLGVTKKLASVAQQLAALPEATREAIAQREVTLSAARREQKRIEMVDQLTRIEVRDAKVIAGTADVLVIDPPWPMVKIERDVRPNQVGFDYPRMSEAELKALTIPAADACHVWLWTTQTFLPLAFQLLQHWNLSYVCTFVWHKPGGFQPLGLPQYNCEFALYARKGTPIFVDTKAFSTCFDAPRGAHSEKPDAFYEMVRRVTAGRRIDMFNRRAIAGFEGWGKEAVSS
jgi:N6-adenosine-specific RNA methylase IME4